MVDKIEPINSNEEIPEPIPSNNYGFYIYKELQMITRLLGAINQNITSLLTPMKHDVEMCKVTLGKMKKIGAQEVTIKDERTPAPYVPPSVGPGRS
jgi:hypothetical protein